MSPYRSPDGLYQNPVAFKKVRGHSIESGQMRDETLRHGYEMSGRV
jgi:hypothetical protein